MAHEHFEVCDGCGFKQKTPSSWSSYNNPLKGWTQICKDAGMGERKEFCPKCTHDGAAAAFVNAPESQTDEGKTNQSA